MRREEIIYRSFDQTLKLPAHTAQGGPMSPLVSLLSMVAIVLAIPSVVFVIEIFASLRLLRLRETQDGNRRSRAAVLIPAHNEAAGILATLSDVETQLRPTDRLLVVADNCADETAEIAAAAGAEVSVRSDLSKIGKGYALDWGLEQLARDPPDVIIVVDADCRLAAHAIDRLVAACEQLGRPVQSLYLMSAHGDSKINHQVAEFAWRVKNFVRPLGLKGLGLPCQLMGSGMAFPWSVLRSADLSTAHIVEDLKLGLDLAEAGYAPIFCPSAIVTSTFPNSAQGAKMQRQRWEHGQISLVLKTAIPRLLVAVRQRNLALLMLVLDLTVPPLSLFLVLLAGTLIVAAVSLRGGMSVAPFVISVTSLGIVLFAIFVAWLATGREALPVRSLGLLLSFLVAKLRQYVAAALGERVSQWVRTDRT